MLIDFVHPGDAYLPELAAYNAFLAAAGHGSRVHRRREDVPADAAVVWWICGQVSQAAARRHAAAFQVHEYASASVPPLAWLKDRVKRWQQPLPSYRLFQNEWVRQRLAFADTRPFEYRDMGVAPEFLFPRNHADTPDFHFVYLGEMRRLRLFLPVLDALATAGYRVLLVGAVPDELWKRLRAHRGLTVTGRVPHQQVPGLLRSASAGLNLVPRVIPYSRQTSTKLLEYCATGLNVLTTDYPWVREFERRHGAGFTYLPVDRDGDSLRRSFSTALEQPPRRPTMEVLAWPAILARLRIWRVIGLQS